MGFFAVGERVRMRDLDSIPKHFRRRTGVVAEALANECYRVRFDDPPSERLVEVSTHHKCLEREDGTLPYAHLLGAKYLGV